MKRIGLTGGIASGKSTVSGILRALGADVIDADSLARDVVEPGTPGLAEVTRRFPGVLGADGRLDRAKLAARIFFDPAERAALNAILHPLIQAEFLRRTGELEAQGRPLVIYDAALLIENGLHRKMDAVVVVDAPEEVQRRRLMERNGLTREEADARLASQMPLREKVPLATWVVDNGGPPEATRAQVERIYRELTG
ncbi:MAG TPA: dephospho-CoA kinase [Myxococcaceae bacterium]|nr:dephospho-CoA kinase [Myxococcaceae bacterium]